MEFYSCKILKAVRYNLGGRERGSQGGNAITGAEVLSQVDASDYTLEQRRRHRGPRNRGGGTCLPNILKIIEN